MGKIVWNEKFSVGVSEIDEQHKKWIRMINELHDMMLRDAALTETILGKLQEMVEYGRTHFSFEENYMESIGFPGLAEHQVEHLTFLQELESHLQQYRHMLPSEVMGILTSWLKNHILVNDMQYKIFLEKKQGDTGV